MSGLFVKKGFTLIELMAATAIISILAYTSIPFGETLYQNVREEKTMSSLEHIREALDAYYRDHGEYPEIPTFSETEDPRYRFTALQTLERELTGKEIEDYPDLDDKNKSQRIYLSEIPPNPYTGKREDWEIRDAYLATWRPINEAMNPATATTSGIYGSGGEGATGTYNLDREQISTTVASGVPNGTAISEINTVASSIGGYPISIYQWQGGPYIGSASTPANINALLTAKNWPGGQYEIARAVNATSTFDNELNIYKTRNIFDIRFPEYLHKIVEKGNKNRDLSEF